MLNSIVMVILVFQGLRDDRRAPGAPRTGLFRTRDFDARRGATDTRLQDGAAQSRDLGF